MKALKSFLPRALKKFARSHLCWLADLRVANFYSRSFLVAESEGRSAFGKATSRSYSCVAFGPPNCT